MQADLEPYNVKHGTSTPYGLRYRGQTIRTILGGISVARTTIADGGRIDVLTIDGETMLGFTVSDGRLLLNLKVYDQNDSLVLWVDENNLAYSADPWDIDFVGRTLTVREAQRKILLRVIFAVPDGIHVKAAHFFKDGYEVVAEGKFVCVVNGGQAVGGIEFEGFTTVLAVAPPEGAEPAAVAVRGEDAPRYPQGASPRYPDKERRQMLSRMRRDMQKTARRQES